MIFFTVVLAGCFSVLYLTAIIPGNISFLNRFIALLKENVTYLAYAGSLAGFLGLFAAPLITHHDSALMIDICDNMMLIVMTFPYSYRELQKRLTGKVNAVVLKEFDVYVAGGILKHERVVGFIGAGLTFLLFLTMFGGFNFEIV